MIFFGILDRLKAKYIFSGALLLLFLLPVLGMALPGGVQHPATPERQTPPDSTPTQAVQNPAAKPAGRFGAFNGKPTAPRPPKHVRKRSRIRFSTPGSTRSSERLPSRRSPPPTVRLPPATTRCCAIRCVRTRPSAIRPGKIFPGRHHQRQKPGLALLRRTQPHGLYLQPG